MGARSGSGTKPLAWFELQAMGRTASARTRRSSPASSRARARAAGFRDRGELLDERRELEAVVRFRRCRGHGCCPRPAEGARCLLRLPQSSRSAAERHRQQARVTADLGDELLKLAEPPGEGRAEVVLRANRDANELKRNLASAKDADRRLVYERRRRRSTSRRWRRRGALRRERTDSARPLRDRRHALRRKRRSRSSAARRPRPRPGESRTPSGRCAVRSSSAFRRRISRASSTPTTRSRSCAPTPTFAPCSRRQPVPRTRLDGKPRP